MSDWSDNPEFKAYAADVINNLLPMIEQSGCTVSLVPNGPGDVKFAVELGLSIMLDKPIILAITPGQQVPEHLARVADGIVEYNPNDPDSMNDQMVAVLRRVLPDLEDLS